MLREHLAGWLTLVFAVLLLMLAFTEQASSWLTTSLLLLFAGVALLLWLRVEGTMHLPHGPRGRTP